MVTQKQEKYVLAAPCKFDFLLGGVEKVAAKPIHLLISLYSTIGYQKRRSSVVEDKQRKTTMPQSIV